MAHSEQTTNKKKMPGVSELRLFLTFVIELCKLCMEVLDGISAYRRQQSHENEGVKT